MEELNLEKLIENQHQAPRAMVQMIPYHVFSEEDTLSIQNGQDPGDFETQVVLVSEIQVSHYKKCPRSGFIVVAMTNKDSFLTDLLFDEVFAAAQKLGGTNAKES